MREQTFERIFEELADHARCLQTQLADRAPADRLLDLAMRGRDAASHHDEDAMLANARVARVVIDGMAADDRASLAGATLKACDECLDRLDRPLSPGEHR